MKLLKERSRDELEAALVHLDEIIQHVVHDMEKAPGPGRQPILDLFRRDRKKITQELEKRGDA
ncbi:hypothetical protein [uncultured Rhodoblastus sp.]|uniref:hypothetical protein n=1 Tax=uncultured Rhodoblastus sp. TaxID=543037 RepID=UPI0025D8155D|nr:hypothetical protein [uncultured Rhodoblastus sp.]